MKYTLLLLLTLCGLAQAAPNPPPCWPKEAGSTGSNYKTGETDLGGWIGWTCQVNGAPLIVGVVWKHGFRPIKPAVAPPTFLASLRTYWQLNVTDNDPSLIPLKLEMRRAFSQHG